MYGCTDNDKRDIRGRLRNRDDNNTYSSGTAASSVTTMEAICHPLLLAGILAEHERNRHRERVRIDVLRLLHLSGRLTSVRLEEWDLEANHPSKNSGFDSDFDDNDDNKIEFKTAALNPTHAMNLWMDVHDLRNGLQSWQDQLRALAHHVDELELTEFCPRDNDREEEKDRKTKLRNVGIRIKERLLEIIKDYDEYIRECGLNMEGMQIATGLVGLLSS